MMLMAREKAQKAGGKGREISQLVVERVEGEKGRTDWNPEAPPVPPSLVCDRDSSHSSDQ